MRVIGAAIGFGRRLVCPHEARAVRENLRYLGLGNDERTIEATFEAFGQFVAELLWGLHVGPQMIANRWRIEGMGHLHDLNRQAKGWILAGAHVGNWEHLGALADRLDRRLVAPTGTQLHPLLSAWIKRRKHRWGIDSVPASRGLRGLTRALDRGRLVALPIDGGSFRRGIGVRLCGRPVRMAAGAARLSRLSGRPIVPVFSTRTGFARQHVVIHPPLWPTSPAEQITQHLADLLGDHLRRARGQWCIFRPIERGEERCPAQ